MSTARARPTEENGDELVLLTQAGPMEANIARAALESAGIFSVLQGEHAAAIDTRIGQLEGVGVLVRRRDLSRAREVISDGSPVLEGLDGPDLEGALCAVHERPAKAPCDRCGAFLCDACGTLGNPPLCEDCVERESEAVPRPKWPGLAKKATAAVLLLPMALGFAVMLILLIARALGWRP
ncbi:MAG: DUF2007 domain-containing protein [Myxococcaceae bacterium]